MRSIIIFLTCCFFFVGCKSQSKQPVLKVQTNGNTLNTATHTAESIADSLIEAISDTWRRFSERATTRVNDICATMTGNGVPEEVVAEYRRSFGSAYEARLDAVYGKPERSKFITAPMQPAASSIGNSYTHSKNNLNAIDKADSPLSKAAQLFIFAENRSAT